MTDHLNVLNLLESKLSSLMELVKSLDAIKAEPSTVNANPNNNPDLLYSQVKERETTLSWTRVTLSVVYILGRYAVHSVDTAHARYLGFRSAGNEVTSAPRLAGRDGRSGRWG